MYKQLYLPALEAGIKKYFGQLTPAGLAALTERVEWQELLAGTTLLRTGEPADGMYILLAGRLAVYLEKTPGEPVLVGTVQRGEPVGEMALLTGGERNATVKASRDSVLVKIPAGDFQAIYEENPAILREFADTVITRLQQANTQTVDRLKPNIAVVPLHAIGDYEGWMDQLVAAVEAQEAVQRVTPSRVAQALGIDPAQLDDPAWRSRLHQCLAEWDGQDAYSLYKAEPALSDWTRRCVRQADEIYLLAEAQHGHLDEALWAYLKDRQSRHPDISYHLILLHPAGTARPAGTAWWLERLRPLRHHHLRQGVAADLRRVARFMTGRAIGLACGGGGAKGLAHVGVLQALEELGVEVDLVAGTSIGAILAATKALDWSQTQLTTACQAAFVETNINDYHLPFYSLLKGRRKERMLKGLFDYQIEDLWLNFLCVSCDLSSSSTRIHTHGSLWQAITASSALPGVFPPFVQDGHFLVDGALVNNLPGDLLRERGANFLVSVDVNVSREIYAQGPDFPSNWTELKRRLLGQRRRKPRFPSVLQTFMRSSYLASTKHAQAVNEQADIALQPPVKGIGLMGWDKMDQAIKAGYAHTMAYFEQHPDQLQAVRAGRHARPGERPRLVSPQVDAII